MYILHKNQIAKKKHESFLIGEKKATESDDSAFSEKPNN